MKLHIGSGSVYLEGYMNIDLPSPRTFFANERPDLVERWKTTADSYYARHSEKNMKTMRHGPVRQEYVCDRYGDFHNLPDGDIDEILTRQTFEHLSITEARRALDRLKQRLRKGAILRIDVPDHEATMRQFMETGDEFYIRHLLGPRNSDRGYHVMSYTRRALRELVEEYNFRFVQEEPNIHCYPAFCLRFEKISDDRPYSKGARDYVVLPEIEPDWKVLDIGPGSYPLLRANVYVDRDPDILAALQLQPWQTALVALLEEGLPEIADKAFDYVWCSHVLEHTADPIQCAATLSRVAKRGTVVLPSAYKDALFNWEESGHLWDVLPNPRSGGSPIFIRRTPEYFDHLRNVDVQAALCFLFRTGSNHDCTVEKYLQTWFAENEVYLDIIVHWTNEFRVQVIQ